MIRVANKETLELVHPLTGKVILTVACDSRWERISIQKDLESAFAHCCEMYRSALKAGNAPHFIAYSIIRQMNYVKEGEGLGTDSNHVALQHKDIYSDVKCEADADLWEGITSQGSQSPASGGPDINGRQIREEHTGSPDTSEAA